MILNQTDSEIIRLFMKRPEAEFTVEDIVKQLKLKISRMTVHRHIKGLVKENILLLNKKGYYNQIRINLGNSEVFAMIALLEAIKKNNIISKLPKLTQELLNKLESELSEHHEVHSAIIFGSYAKEKQHPESDLDLLILLNDFPVISGNKKQFDKDLRDRVRASIQKVNKLYGEPLTINTLIMNVNDYRGMLLDKKENVGKQSFHDHILLKGDIAYWHEIKRYLEEKR